MIETNRLSKSFGDIQAVNNVTMQIKEQEVFGLLGTNGAGKSTFLRLLAGVLQEDGGTIRIDGRPVFDDPATKQNLFFVPGDPYYYPNATPAQMMRTYAGLYRHFDEEHCRTLLKDFELDPERRIATFSKGMKRQLSLLLGLCAGTKYLLMDETFDGLDPAARQTFKSLFAREISDRGLTPVIASHNLREIEDFCDHVGLLYKGGVLLSENIVDMKLGIQKLQCVFTDDADAEEIGRRLKVLLHERRGRVHTFTIKGSEEEITAVFRGMNTIFFEMMPLSLEEIFLVETELAGYDVRKLIDAQGSGTEES